MTRSLNSALSFFAGSAEVNCAQFAYLLNTTTENFQSTGYENEAQRRTIHYYYHSTNGYTCQLFTRQKGNGEMF